MKSDPAPDKGDSYEAFIAELIGFISDSNRKISDIQYAVWQKNVISGTSGCVHQIDISFMDASVDKPTLVLIEGKNTPSVKIKKVQVAAFKAIIDDISAIYSSRSVIGIFAYAGDPQPGAKTFARYYGIQMSGTGVRPNFSFKYGTITQIGMHVKVNNK